MSTKLKQVYLLKDCQKTFQCETGRNGDYQGELGLFQPELENVKQYPNQRYEDKEIRDIKTAIEQFSKPPVKETWLQLVAQYDTFYESYKVMLKGKLNSCFAKKLCTDLLNPKLLVQGTFKFQNGLRNNQWQKEDTTLHTFRLIDIELEKDQNISDFEGALKMVEICNKTPQRTDLLLNYSVLLTWKDSRLDFPDMKVNVLEKLFGEKILADCSLILANGSEVKCHRSVLAAQSDVFHTMFTSGFSETKSCRIEMKDVSEECLNSFLTYLYKGKMNTEGMTEEIAIELLQIAHKYNVSALENIMLEMLFIKTDDWYSIDSALSLYFMTLHVSAHNILCTKMFEILKRNTKKLRSSTIFKDLEEKNSKVALDLAFKLLDDETDNQTELLTKPAAD